MSAFTACASKESEPVATSGDGAVTSVTGIYTNTLTGEDMRNRLVASWSAVTHLETLIQNNSLVLTAKNSTITTGDRYELTKDLFNGEMGIHIEARFYGEYTYEGNNVTLKTPEFYTWIYYRNGQIMGESHIYEPVNLEATESDGCSFFGDYLDYHGYHKTDEMNIKVNPSDSSFLFDIVMNDDIAELGVESEDDGFNTSPVFNTIEDSQGEIE